MSVHLHVSPAASGKTEYLVGLVWRAAQGLRVVPRIVVPTPLQVHAWRRRLAAAGGAMGVRLLTFDQLYAECLNAAGEVYTELSEPVQYRLIRAMVDDLSLVQYAPLAGQPGFIQVLAGLIAEFKAAQIWPERLVEAVLALGGEPRLLELAQVYAAYQHRLQEQQWADRAGLGWLAVEALAERAPGIARDWPLVIVDGFDDFTPVQLALLRLLGQRVEEMTITLTGSIAGDERPLVHQRFQRTRERLEEAFGVRAGPLPQPSSGLCEPLAHLETWLFRGEAPRTEAAGAVDLVEVPDRTAEVRTALRWLKERLVMDGVHPDEVALLARSISPYHPFIQQTAAEFELPVRLVGGLPLRTNPAIAALLDLLRLVLPRADGEPEPSLPRRLVIEAWRSPYLDWSSAMQANPSALDVAQPVGIQPRDADTLDAVARWGRVVGGLSQWEEVLGELVAAMNGEEASRITANLASDEERGLLSSIPTGAEAQALRGKFDRFVQRLLPPTGQQSYREFVSWLEALIGPDPPPSPAGPASWTGPTDEESGSEEACSLRVVLRARAGPGPSAERDVAALRALKDVLRGLVWAEEALRTPPVSFRRFFDELVGAVDAAVYDVRVHAERQEILVADVVQARGLPFRAVAVLGLSEGEFPATLREDPFLRDADRRRLSEMLGSELQLSTESAEIEFFYETITRARERLLCTRPRLADNGAPWQTSPFWEELRRLLHVRPVQLASESQPSPERTASWPELMESLARAGLAVVRAWVEQIAPLRQAAFDRASEFFRLRRQREPVDHGEGDLSAMSPSFAQQFGPPHIWSASRLEAYRACPFLFFVGSVLNLEPREEPAEGLDVRQLGNIYHRILEQVYRSAMEGDPADVSQLLAILPSVAKEVLDKAPRQEGFRETAWWAQTRDEIVDEIRRSLEALAAVQGGFRPFRLEAPFGLAEQPPLVVRDEQCGSFRLRGFIDRVDRAPDGHLRIIDYKTSSPSSFTKGDMVTGKKLQLPLYALAAQDALGLGEPVEGFYWHVRHAEASGCKLSTFEGGAREAMAAAVAKAWEAIREVRGGRFVPHAPDGGCPSYCPAAEFCWHYRSGFLA